MRMCVFNLFIVCEKYKLFALGQMRNLYLLLDMYWIEVVHIAYRRIILFNIFLFANKRARSLKGIVQSNVRKQAVATLFDYIILYRDIVNVTETVLSTFYSRGGCFTFHLFKAKPKRAPAISTFHSVGDGRINFS